MSALPATDPEPPQQIAMEPAAPEPLRLVGEVFKTYIVTERGAELCLIDKHAAHERILFEKLAQDYGHVPAQMLLVPVQVNLTAAEKQALLQNLDLLADAGLEAEDFGGATVIVRAVPADVAVDDVEDMVVELAAHLAEGGRSALREKTEWVLHSIACRAAIRRGTARRKPRCWRWRKRSWTAPSRRSARMAAPACSRSPGRSWKNSLDALCERPRVVAVGGRRRPAKRRLR